jgi:5-methylthioadenosine/S-adenosylhomocysteine deaminase
MPDTPSHYALRGRIVTMDAKNPADKDTVIPDGVIYIADGVIADITTPTAPVPAAFKDAPRISTRGTIYPGLMELHNHLSYNILPLWKVSGTYTNNSQWRNAEDKRKLISGPMSLLNDAGGYLGAIVRYVETKCLVAGVTTSQGLTLIGAGGIPKKYRGIVRNCEEPDDPDLPEASHRIDDVDSDKVFKAKDFKEKLANLKGSYLLHLSEGIDVASRKHFLALQIENENWAITSSLIGIHAAGLHPEDFPILQANRGSIVWSPLSNMMLYGETAHMDAAKASRVLISLGADWSPSGSKNLLAELKIARLYSKLHGNLFTDAELVRMVTSNPARMLKWFNKLGSIEKGKLADLLVIRGQARDSYKKLVTCSEMDVSLVVIGGMPRYGLTSIMEDLHQDGEKLTLTSHGVTREWMMNLAGAPDAAVAALTYQDAFNKLKAGLDALPNPAPLPVIAMGAADEGGAPVEQFKLLLDNDDVEGYASRALLPLTTADVIGDIWAASVDLHALVKPIVIDELTVAEDPHKYVDQLTAQPHLKPEFKAQLATVYGAK